MMCFVSYRREHQQQMQTSDQFQILVSPWTCPRCSFENTEHYYMCGSCSHEEEEFHLQKELNEAYKLEDKFAKLERHFGRTSKILLPVVSCFDEHHFRETIDMLYPFYERQDIQGIWLINTNCSVETLETVAMWIHETYPNLWVGINILGYNLFEVTQFMYNYSTVFKGLWVDNPQITAEGPYQNVPEIVASLFHQASWDGLYFGGTLFKYIRVSKDINQQNALCVNSIPYMDVITTSGDGTGIAISTEKIQRVHSLVHDQRPVGLASGVTAENIDSVKDFTDVYIVGTYFYCGDTYNISEEKLAILSRKINEEA